MEYRHMKRTVVLDRMARSHAGYWAVCAGVLLAVVLAIVLS